MAPDGSQVGVQSIQEAMWLADQLGLDLVEVAPTAKPPVTKIMDYGKYKYEQSVKDREARKNSSKSTVKEITFRVKISSHDFQIKSDRAKKFLEHGDKVRVRIWFRGREASRPTLGSSILDRLTVDLEGIGKVDQEPKQEGKNMTMTFSPAKTPRQRSADAQAEAEVQAATAAAAADSDVADEIEPDSSDAAPADEDAAGDVAPGDGLPEEGLPDDGPPDEVSEDDSNVEASNAEDEDA